MIRCVFHLLEHAPLGHVAVIVKWIKACEVPADYYVRTGVGDRGDVVSFALHMISFG